MSRSKSEVSGGKSRSGTREEDEKRGKVEKRAAGSEGRRGPFGAIGRFLGEVVGELKKVVTPTRQELFRYTGVVLAFVVFMMVLVTLLDLLFGIGVSWVFGTGTEVSWPDFGQIFGGTPAPSEPPAQTPAP